MGDHRDVRVERRDRPPRRLDLLLADTVTGVDHLPLQVRQLHDVEVHDPDRADTRRGQVEGRRGPESPRADQHHPGAEELRLPGGPDLRDQQVTAVAELLLVGEPRRRPRPLQAHALPGGEAAAHRGHVRVAHRRQRLPCEQRPEPAGAVQHDRRLPGRDRRLDVLLQVALRHQDRAREMALVPLDRLADVDQRDPAAPAERVHLGGCDLADLGAGLVQQLRVGPGHATHCLAGRVGPVSPGPW